MPITVDVVAMVANTGGTLGLAIFAIWMLNRVWADRLDAEKRRVIEMEALRSETLNALKNNTQAMTQLCERMDEDSRALALANQNREAIAALAALRTDKTKPQEV
ncbi:MAG: hypothetical protein KKA73_13570 [Chloroflexi bacterium]|nr:hypothetical protein [Chloroflexota bacterium]MBU1748711.1 hypothetical protein [Chloroflexota bacterium]